MRKALEAGDRIVDNALLSLPRDGEDAYLDTAGAQVSTATAMCAWR